MHTYETPGLPPQVAERAEKRGFRLSDLVPIEFVLEGFA